MQFPRSPQDEIILSGTLNYYQIKMFLFRISHKYYSSQLVRPVPYATWAMLCNIFHWFLIVIKNSIVFVYTSIVSFFNAEGSLNMKIPF